MLAQLLQKWGPHGPCPKQTKFFGRKQQNKIISFQKRFPLSKYRSYHHPG